MSEIIDDGFILVENSGETAFPEKEGDTVVGIPAGEKTIKLDDGSEFQRLLLQQSDGKKRELRDHAQVRRAFDRFPTSILRITYNGKKRIKDGKTVADYNIAQKSAS